MPKPAPDLLLLADAQLGVTPTRMLFVGDSPADMAAARACGAVAVAAGWGQQFPDIQEFDMRAETPHDVLSLLA